MNPYEVLHLPSTASPDDAEAAYRQLLRAYHPDLHQGGGAEQLAWAESMTRELNEAIGLVRDGWRPAGWVLGTAPAGPDFGFRTAPDTDWFGNPLDRRVRAEAVDCPLCGRRFTDAVAYRAHLAYDHRHPGTGPHQPPPSERRSALSYLRWVGWIPAPAFWFFVVLVGYWLVVLATLGESWVAIVAVWLGVIWYLLFLRLAYKLRRPRV